RVRGQLQWRHAAGRLRLRPFPTCRRSSTASPNWLANGRCCAPFYGWLVAERTSNRRESSVDLARAFLELEQVISMDLLTVREAADVLRLSSGAVYALCK